VQRLDAVNEAARDFEQGASLAAIKAERHRLFLKLESRLPAAYASMSWGGEDGCPLAAHGE
jgi:hypothetical protein